MCRNCDCYNDWVADCQHTRCIYSPVKKYDYQARMCKEHHEKYNPGHKVIIRRLF